MVPRKPGLSNHPKPSQRIICTMSLPYDGRPRTYILVPELFPKIKNALFPNPRTPSKREIALSTLSPESSSHPALGRRARARSAPAPREYTPSVAFFGSRLTLSSFLTGFESDTHPFLSAAILLTRSTCFPCLPWGVLVLVIFIEVASLHQRRWAGWLP